MKVLFFDPGGTTGWTKFEIDVVMNGFIKKHFTYGHIGNNSDHHTALWTFLVHEHPDRIVCERFDNRGNEFAKFMSLEYIGIIKLYGKLFHVPITWQSPSNKEWAKNDVLTRMTLLIHPWSKWKHANDAMRHAVYWIVFSEYPDEMVQRTRTLLLQMMKTDS